MRFVYHKLGSAEETLRDFSRVLFPLPRDRGFPSRPWGPRRLVPSDKAHVDKPPVDEGPVDS